MQFFQKMITGLSTLAAQLRLVVTEILKVFKEIGAALKFAYEEIGDFLTTIAKGINSFWHLIFGKFAELVSYIVYLSSVFGFFLAFEIRYDSKLTKILADLEINVQFAKLLSLPAFLLLVYILMRVLSRQKKHHLIGIVLVIAVWCGYRGYDYHIKKDYIIDPISEKSIACITAENDRYKLVNCNLKRNGKNRKPVIEITEAVARANAIEGGYIIPKKIPVSCNLRFFSIDGDTLLYSHVDEQNLIELSNLPVHHEKTNMVYRPVTREIIARICAEERQQKTRTNQVESANLQIENHALEAENQLLRRQKQEDDSVRLKPGTTSDPIPPSDQKTKPSSEITLLIGGRVVKYSDLQPGYVSEDPKKVQEEPRAARKTSQQAQPVSTASLSTTATDNNTQPTHHTDGSCRMITTCPKAENSYWDSDGAFHSACIAEFERANHLACTPNLCEGAWNEIFCENKTGKTQSEVAARPKKVRAKTATRNSTKTDTTVSQRTNYNHVVKCSEGCQLQNGKGICSHNLYGWTQSCTFPRSETATQGTITPSNIHKVTCPEQYEPAFWAGPDCCRMRGVIVVGGDESSITKCGFPTEDL